MDIPVIEQAKIQARVLVPLVKALRAELGEAGFGPDIKLTRTQTIRGESLRLSIHSDQALAEEGSALSGLGLAERIADGIGTHAEDVLTPLG